MRKQTLILLSFVALAFFAVLKIQKCTKKPIFKKSEVQRTVVFVGHEETPEPDYTIPEDIAAVDSLLDVIEGLREEATGHRHRWYHYRNKWHEQQDSFNIILQTLMQTGDCEAAVAMLEKNMDVLADEIDWRVEREKRLLKEQTALKTELEKEYKQGFSESGERYDFTGEITTRGFKLPSGGFTYKVDVNCAGCPRPRKNSIAVLHDFDNTYAAQYFRTGRFLGIGGQLQYDIDQESVTPFLGLRFKW